MLKFITWLFELPFKLVGLIYLLLTEWSCVTIIAIIIITTLLCVFWCENVKERILKIAIAVILIIVLIVI